MSSYLILSTLKSSAIHTFSRFLPTATFNSSSPFLNTKMTFINATTKNNGMFYLSKL